MRPIPVEENKSSQVGQPLSRALLNSLKNVNKPIPKAISKAMMFICIIKFLFIPSVKLFSPKDEN
jgi:hypothetical protein